MCVASSARVLEQARQFTGTGASVPRTSFAPPDATPGVVDATRVLQHQETPPIRRDIVGASRPMSPVSV